MDGEGLFMELLRVAGAEESGTVLTELFRSTGIAESETFRQRIEFPRPACFLEQEIVETDRERR
jgi:hypothetical protein